MQEKIKVITPIYYKYSQYIDGIGDFLLEVYRYK